jgi:hypothetical protein
VHESSALITGGTLDAARAVHEGTAEHAVNLAGGLHGAMRDGAVGFSLSTTRLDPLADRMLTVDGQQAANAALHELDDEMCGGPAGWRWAGAATRWSEWCPGPGPSCWRWPSGSPWTWPPPLHGLDPVAAW